MKSRGILVFARINFAKDAPRPGWPCANAAVILGSPLAGTLLISAAPATALDLPQGARVAGCGNRCWVSFNTPEYLQRRHSFRGADRQYCRLGKLCRPLLHRSRVESAGARNQDLRIGGVIGGFDCDDGFAQLRMLVAKISGELLLGLCGTINNISWAPASAFATSSKMMICARSMTAMRALTAVDPLMLIFRVHHRLFLFCRREVPRGCLLVINPNNCMIV